MKSSIEVCQFEDPNFFEYIIRNDDENGWHFGAGNPEFWQFSDRLLVEDGKLLDVGIGQGRSSYFFGLQGMEVTGVDSDSRSFDLIRGVYRSLGLNAELISGELEHAGVLDESFDTVLLDHTFSHQPTRDTALDILENAYLKLKPGGHIWVRANGVDDSGRSEMLQAVADGYTISGGAMYNQRCIPFEGRVLDDGYVIEHPCNCSGEVRQDPTLFLEQIELPVQLLNMGASLVHTQVIPNSGSYNIRFGEDFKDNPYFEQSGLVTVLAQKPSQK